MGAVTATHTPERWVVSSTPTRRTLFGIAFNNASGVAVGADGCVFATGDAGRSWTLCGHGRERLRAVAVESTGLTWVAGWRGTLLLGQPGSRDWRALDARARVKFEALQRLDEATLLVAGSDGTILRTTDGGRTWRKTRTRCCEDLRGLAAAGPRVWAVGAHGTILVSDDHGVSWRRQQSGTSEELRAIVAADSRFAVAVGAAGTIVRTQDGETWSPVLLERLHANLTSRDLNSIAVSSSGVLCAAGSGMGAGYSPIIVSEDGGRSWRFEASHTVNPLYGVAWTGTGFCAVGRFGTVVRCELGVSAASG